MDQGITIKFTTQQLDYVYTVLAQRPYSEVESLIGSLKAQVIQQRDSRIGEPAAQAGAGTA